MAHDLPPTLSPRSIQVGRLLTRLAGPHEIYLATSSYSTKIHCDVYTDVQRLCKDTVSIKSIIDSPFLGIGMRLAPFFFHIPDPSRWDMGRMEKQIIDHWPSVSFDRIVTFACPFSSHLLGRCLKSRYKVPWLAHFSDPWAENPLSENSFLTAPINKRQEQRVVSEADRIVFVSRETKDFYSGRYPAKKSKFGLLEHYFDDELYPPPVPPKTREDILVFRFLGNLYGGRSIESLLKSLAKVASLPDNKNVKWKMEFILSYNRQLGPLIEKYRLTDRLHLLPSTNYRKSLELMQTADVLINIDASWPRSLGPNLFFPSKLVDYMGAGRMIFGLAGPGASRRIIEGYGGLVADPEEGESVRRSVEKLFSQWREGVLQKFQPRPEGRGPYSISEKIVEFERLLA